MFYIDKKLALMENEGRPIKVGIVGAGQMGRTLVSQLVMIKGVTPTIVANRNEEKAINSFLNAGIKKDDIVVAFSVKQANAAIENNKFVATPYSEIVTSANLVDCIVDATGVPEVGATVATSGIKNNKHMIMLNVETDVVIGPYLKSLAIKNNVIYTGSAGDEPGAVMELYSFANAIGFDVKVIGKGKNNKLDKSCTPDTVFSEAKRKNMSAKMLCSFKDGTKTMVEMSAMSNATGFVPDIIGAHGISSNVEGLNEKFKLKKDGGILNAHKVVEYVDGIAPGVFVTVYSDNPEFIKNMDYLTMGSGPLWTLYRPYHLCSLETPISIARAIINKEATIQPLNGLVSECVAVAKRDLKANEKLDGIGGYTTYGTITTFKQSQKNNFVPYGLVNENATALSDIKKGEILTWSNTSIDTTQLIYKLRKEQDKMKWD